MTEITADVTVVGAGVFGLTLALALEARGARVQVVEKAHIGAGASGGILGALMPHVPEQWNPKKQFQFEALSQLEAYTQALEAKTGLETGYARQGRLIPLTTEHELKHALERQENAATLWKTKEKIYQFQHITASGISYWLNSDTAPYGVVHDTLAAKLTPYKYLSALATAIKGEIKEHAGQTKTLAPQHIKTESGLSAYGQKTVVTAGYETFELLAPLLPKKLGTGIKGQASLLELAQALPEPLPPVIYHDGVYVVAHDAKTVAVGSTSERDWLTPDVDPNITDYLDKARAFCPALEDAKLIRHWAGIRPRARKREPALGEIPGHKGLYVMTGGFKISFGIAHLLAEAMADMVLELEPTVNLPEVFRLEHHLS